MIFRTKLRRPAIWFHALYDISNKSNPAGCPMRRFVRYFVHNRVDRQPRPNLCAIFRTNLCRRSPSCEALYDISYKPKPLAERVGFASLGLRTCPPDMFASRPVRTPLIAIQQKNDPVGVVPFFVRMAERVGFEPTHALRRLDDFESTPLDHLGTSPQQEVSYHRSIVLASGRKHMENIAMLAPLIRLPKPRLLPLAEPF